LGTRWQLRANNAYGRGLFDPACLEGLKQVGTGLNQNNNKKIIYNNKGNRDDLTVIIIIDSEHGQYVPEYRRST
jgi:hypothetical protein